LLLDDPVEAVVRWSQDPTLQVRASLTNGEQLTAVELQLRFLDAAKRFVAEGGCDALVPRADEIVALWEDTLVKLQAGDFESLASRLDWVLKLSVLQQVLDENPKLNWDSPEIKHLDHLYSSLDSSEGLYWAFEKSGLLERVVADEDIERFTVSPPDDTRAWTRAMLLRWAGPDAVDDVDWDSIRFKTGYERYRTIYRRLELANPLAFTRSACEGAFETAATLDELLDLLGGPVEDRNQREITVANSAMSYGWDRD